MSVLTDGFTPKREELTRLENLRAGEPHRQGQPTRGSLHDHEPDLQEVRGTHELHPPKPKTDTEPHGMYWTTDQDGRRILKPHAWFVEYIAVQANKIFQITRDAIGSDEETINRYTALGEALKEYIEQREAINPRVRERKFKQELDDAAYQFCQAAKFKVDAEERAKFLVSRDEDALDNEQINKLIESAQESADEGFILAYAIFHAGYTEPMNFRLSAKRVVEYSCRRLTEWFAQRRVNEEKKAQLNLEATQTIIDNLFLRRPS